MNDVVFSLGAEQLDRIFPFHIRVNDELKITSSSRSITKLHPVETDSLFFDNFRLHEPKIDVTSFTALKEIAGRFAVLDFKKENICGLQGQFEYLPELNQLLFIGTPCLNTLEEIKDRNLAREDFAQFDSLFELLERLKSDHDQQQQLELQLKINEKRYRDLFNYSQAFIFTHDLNGKLLTVNPAICEKLGYTSEELTGRMITDFIPKADLVNFNTAYLDTVNRKGSAKGVFRVSGKTDKKSFLLYQNFKVEEENTEPYIIGFSQDITERIKIEKELRKTKHSAEETARAKEIFLANMSHEIRTPLSGILGITNLLTRTKLNEQQLKYATLISSSANSLLTIVNDVLDIEKIASGKFDLEHIPFKLADKVNTTIQSFQFKAEEKNVVLSFKSNVADDLIVIGDPSRLGQILNNLLSNALKFTSNGGIYVSIYYYKNDQKTTTLEFEVSDTGIGIKPDKLADIFNPFVQASSDTSRKFGGTGLGLSICKDLIEMQGGSIMVNSEVNMGTTFTFYIPYEKGDAAMLEKESTADIDFKTLNDIKILVAEDWELNQFLVQHILESWGVAVTMVNNGLEALNHVKKGTYDLILMDIHMPEMDGITATKEIRALRNPEKSAIPIIALTANALKGDHLHYIAAGMNECVTKPYTEEKLFQVINKVIKRSTVMKENIPAAAVHIEDDNFIAQSSILYDLTFINEFAKGDMSFVKKMISVFLDAMNIELKALIAASNEHRYDAISKIAHKMKSAIDGLGIHSLKQIIRELETTNFNNPDKDEPGPLIEIIKSTLEEVFIQLEGFLKL